MAIAHRVEVGLLEIICKALTNARNSALLFVCGSARGVNGTDTSLLRGPDAQPRSTNSPTAMFLPQC